MSGERRGAVARLIDDAGEALSAYAERQRCAANLHPYGLTIDDATTYATMVAASGIVDAEELLEALSLYHRSRA